MVNSKVIVRFSVCVIINLWVELGLGLDYCDLVRLHVPRKGSFLFLLLASRKR